MRNGMMGLGLICIVVIWALYFDAFGFRTWLGRQAIEAGYMESAYFLHPHSAGLLLRIGDYYLQENQNISRALRTYRHALEEDPKIQYAHHQLSRIYFIHGDFENAQKEINEELKLYPNDFRSLYVRALNEAFSGDMTSAEEDFRKSLELDPTEWGTYNDLSWVLAKQGQFDESAEIARLGIERVLNGAENPWLWNALGVALFNRNEYASAKDAFINAGQYADRLTEESWHRAYSANSRSSVPGALASFKEDIKKNIITTENRLREK